MYIKRTLILSKISDDNIKALVTIQKAEGNPYLQVKFSNQFDSELFVAIRYSNSPIELVQLKKVEEHYEGQLPNYFDCSGEIYVAILSLNGNKLSPYYLGGAQSQRQIFYSEVLKNLNYFENETLSSLSKGDFLEECKTALVDNQPKSSEQEEFESLNADLFEEPSQNEIDDAITDSLLMECLNQKDKCENCIYKKAFYDNKKDYGSLNESEFIGKTNIETTSNKKEESQTEVVMQDSEDNEVINDKTIFFNQIKKSLDSLFEAYPVDNILQNAIEDSSFVKVDYENTGDYYSVGYIKENEIPKYICYAIPCKPNSPPPEDMQEFSQYLPVNDEIAYYLMYQNASNGETIKINAV